MLGHYMFVNHCPVHDDRRRYGDGYGYGYTYGGGRGLGRGYIYGDGRSFTFATKIPWSITC